MCSVYVVDNALHYVGDNVIGTHWDLEEVIPMPKIPNNYMTAQGDL
jgi:hypothetical protein